jgi:GTP-binding protein Era
MTQSPKAGFVAIIGEPNVGKSTLMNAILGAKLSIVTPKPQTTRRNVLGIYTEGSAENGVQIVFFDTPGAVAKASYELHRSMLDFVKQSIESADAILIVADVQKLVARGERKYNAAKSPEERGADALESLTKRLQTSLENVDKPVVVALNKMDALPDKKRALPVMDALMQLPFVRHVAPISALENKFVDELVEKLKEFMPPHEFFYDAELLSTQPQRFFVAEIIRETIFMRYREEIPYSTEVSVVEFKERERGKWYISADIIVERDTQKRILIGKGGAALKETGSAARAEVERYLESPVFLELFVKVREDWRNNKTHLRSFGYGAS